MISGPSFNGVSFSYPDEPFSTNGHQMFDCQQHNSCTNMIKIPLGKALSDTISEKVLIFTGFDNYEDPKRFHSRDDLDLLFAQADVQFSSSYAYSWT